MAFGNLLQNPLEVMVEVLAYKTVLWIHYLLFLKYFGTEEEAGDGFIEVEELGRMEGFKRVEERFWEVERDSWEVEEDSLSLLLLETIKMAWEKTKCFIKARSLRN